MSECVIAAPAATLATVPETTSTVVPIVAKATLDTPFEAIPVSTQTIIGTTNLKLDVVALYNALELEQYVFTPRRRGRRPKDMSLSDMQPRILHDGAIITAKYGPEMRGAAPNGTTHGSPSLAEGTPSSSPSIDGEHEPVKYFRNALTVVMFSHSKLVNFKISRNGKLQFTGAKSVDYAVTCVKHLWTQLLRLNEAAKANSKPNIITDFTTDPGTLTCTFETVMTNMDFKIGFEIDRNKLNEVVASVDGYHSFTETTFGYSGLNLKMPCLLEQSVDVPVLTIDSEGNSTITTRAQGIPASSNGRTRHTTFLVFRSGSVIVSGTNPDTIRPCFQKFADFVRANRARIESV